MQVVLFEDSNVDQLSPITLMRPASRITCGGLQLRHLLQKRGYRVSESVRPHLSGIVGSEACPDHAKLFINARLIPHFDNLETIEQVLRTERSCAISDGSSIGLVYVTDGIPVSRDTPVVSTLPATIVARDLHESDAALELFEFPHDVVRAHVQYLNPNLQCLIQSGEYQEVRDGVFVSSNVVIDSQAEFDTKCGPVLIERDVKIRPFSFLRGPILLDTNSRINEHSSVKDNVYVGPHCKVGGEVEESTLEGFSNKQHYGFLGHSYVGSWVNLGAGTSNSDLKNTYGEIRMEYDGARISTGMQFLGSIIGDYSKTAVNTAIFTGKTIGVAPHQSRPRSVGGAADQARA